MTNFDVRDVDPRLRLSSPRHAAKLASAARPGATREEKREAPGGNIQLDLHGLQLNVTTISETQKRQQHLGIEHIAVQTDDYAGAIAKLRGNGAHIMEEMFNNGRHVAFIEAPDGAQMELIEKV